MIKLQQFSILKINSSRLKRSKYKIEELTPNIARETGELVQLGDSQFLRTIRKVTNHPYDPVALSIAKKYKHYDTIDNLTFIPDYLSVVIDSPAHYKKIMKSGVMINGNKYVRFSCSASNARVNTVFLINDKIYGRVNEILKNGAKSIEITKAKYNAYFALLSSSTYEVREPNVCVIPDYEITLNHEFDFFEEDGSVNRKYVDIENYPPFDGQGLIDVEMSKKWAEDLRIDYIPSAFCIRNAYVKGMLATMPVREYAKANGITDSIKDVWGNVYKIDDVDVILSASQFKLWKAYYSWEHYVECCRSNEINWGVTRVTPKVEKNVAFTNYQFLQVLDLDDRQIESLCEPTVKWINDVMGGDIMTTALCLLGRDIEFDKIEDNAVKALLINNELIKDQYIQNKIIRNINKKIRQAYAGKLVTNGNFMVMMSDPFAMMEFYCGQEVVGLLNDREHFVKYWNDRDVDKVAACRSPLTWRSEVNILNLKNDEKMKTYYRYLDSGVVYNIYGNDTMRHAD